MKPKIAIQIVVYEKDGKQTVNFEIEENDATMANVALLVYTMEQAKMDLVDRVWKKDDYYEIEGDDNG